MCMHKSWLLPSLELDFTFIFLYKKVTEGVLKGMHCKTG